MLIRESARRAFLAWALALPALLLTCGAKGQETEQASDAPQAELTDTTYSAWRDHILPAREELDWQQIPWLTTYKDGIVAANEAGMPLLLWTMNGHPLGCT